MLKNIENGNIKGRNSFLEMRERQECKTEKIPLNNIIHAHRNRKEQKKTK